MADGPSFDIPARPERRFPASGGLEYDGGTMFVLDPAADQGDAALASLVETVLTEGPYRSGDFVELPMPLYLVRDDETGDVFRISVRDGAVRLHVLPETDSAGLRAFYDRLQDASDCDWAVACREA
ncbi:hypothetical protein ACKVMT_00390 [Halobacteriales archaeon Cl-PHB]